MTVPELRAHLDDRLEVLARRRGVNARHQSLRATVAWSYDLLTDVEQSFFDELSAFGADFGVQAARAVGGDTTVPVEDLLMSLVDKSLLTANRGPLGMRFRQLETVRQYGEARLQGRGGCRRACVGSSTTTSRWTESADAGIKSPDELHWHQWFTAEWPNVRNVFRWACTVDDGDAACRLVSATLWWATSRMQLEADRWCELALDAVGGRPPAEAGRVGGRCHLLTCAEITTVTGSRSSAAPRSGASGWSPRRGWR